jgi:hypothetical protein
LKRRTRTTTETHEIWIVRRAPHPAPGSPAPGFCPACGVPSWMLAPDEAAALAGVSQRTVYDWVEAGLVHFEEGAAGLLFICLASLPRAAG